MKKTFKNKWVILALTLLVAGGIYWKVKKNKASNSTTTTTTVQVEKGPIEERVEATGEVSPMNRVEIKPPISGRIEQLLADEGDKVKAGQVLAWMSSSDRAAILDAARSQGPAEVKKWQDAYKPTPVVAPLSGVLILRNVVVGQTVDASAVLFAMSDKLIVLANVDEADIGRVKTNMPARVTLDAYPDTSVDGRVFQILQEGTNVSNVITYGVKVELKETPAFFRSQMTANVNLILKRKEDALIVPATAVYDGRGGGKQVMIPIEKGKPERRDVETGIESGDRIEIVSGVTEGETILITRARYTPQRGQQNSPLAFGGKKQAQGQSQQRSGAARQN
jgi:macrolide-specific efflux system membrane fusion protein